MSSSVKKTGMLSPQVAEKIEYAEADWKSTVDDDTDLEEYAAEESTSAISRLLHRIPKLTSRRGGDDCSNYSYHYHVAATEDGLESPTETKPAHRIRRFQPSKWLKRLRRLLVTLPLTILCLLYELRKSFIPSLS